MRAFFTWPVEAMSHESYLFGLDYPTCPVEVMSLEGDCCFDAYSSQHNAENALIISSSNT